MHLTDIHPLIDGLVRELPVPGMPMAEDRHQDWLDCAAAILALLYPEPIESTAARKDVRDNTTEGSAAPQALDPAAGITQPAGTQAPPVDAHSAAGPAADIGGSNPAPMAEVAPATSADHSPETAITEGSVPATPDSSASVQASAKSGVTSVGASPAPTPDVRTTFVPPKGEMSERTAKRVEVDDLHHAEPWLSPDEAAARLLIPVVNLRIFTSELGIEWSQPHRVLGEQMLSAPSGQPQMLTLRDKVRIMHEQHPTWTASMIAAELGANRGTVKTYLLEMARDLSERPVEKEQSRVVA